MISQSPGVPWPLQNTGTVLFVLDAVNRLERKILQDWLESTRTTTDSQVGQVVVPISNPKGQMELGDLTSYLEFPEDTLVVPLRVVWLPPDRTSPRFRDLLIGDPRRPGTLIARHILRKYPERVHRLAGEPATIVELRERSAEHQADDSVDSREWFAGFVARQAGLSLDVAERRLRGNRYKVPRFVAESLRTSLKFNTAIDKLATELGRPGRELHREAQGYLKEMVATPNTFFIDWMGKFSRYVASLGYQKIVCDPASVERIRQIVRDNPSALLWSHKSHMDGIALLSVLYENDFPAPHSLGGINMAFTGIGFLGRRSGVIFIRRTFQDNPLYKLVLRQYLGYLMEKRFPFSWAFEGTRSRVGKLMPPRIGLLKYVVEAAHSTKAKNLNLIPVSISYDLIGDTSDYVLEQSGKKKRPESLRWFLGYLFGLRKPMGRIYIEFGEPVVLKDAPPVDDSLDLAKIAFDVAVQVNNVTPITLPSLACMVLLGSSPQALTLDGLTIEMRALIRWARVRKLPMTTNFDPKNMDELLALAEVMIDRGLVTRYDEGLEAVYGIASDQHPVASYYRNTVVHYFVNKAILELALLKASDIRTSEAETVFWKEALWLRDLFKFEFFYSPSNDFPDEIRQELTLDSVAGENTLVQGGEAISSVLAGMPALVAHATVLPYVEAYSIVSDVFTRVPSDEGLEQKECVALSLKYGRQAYLQRHISSNASIGKLLFENAYKLLHNMGLTIGGDDMIGAKRAEVAHEFHNLARRLDRIKAMVSNRRDAQQRVTRTDVRPSHVLTR